jgi:predicted SAM-dependent methyltransferase
MKSFLLFFFSHQTLANIRWDLHMLKVRGKNMINGSHRKISEFARTREAPVYLNLGSGPRGLISPHWINVDAFPDTNVHFLLDFNRSLPLIDASLDGVFCEHVLEHFTYEDGLKLMTEICRCLKIEGTLRVVVPDAEWVMRSYFDQPAKLVAHREGTEKSDIISATPMEIVNQYFRQRYEHHFLYDFTTMEKLLKSAGFSHVTRVSFSESENCAHVALDHPKYQTESLYVEAIK